MSNLCKAGEKCRFVCYNYFDDDRRGNI